MKKKRFILPLMVLVLFSVACSVLGGAKANATPTVKPAEVLLPSAIPTQEVMAMPTQPAPTMAPLVVEPTQEAVVVAPDAPASSEPEWETWVAAGDPSRDYVEIARGKLIFEIPSPETYVYADRVEAVYEDVAVETEFETLKGGANGIAVICRGSNRGWYELRVTTINSSSRPYAGSYELYRYDYKLKEQGKNPYYNLLKNMARINSMDIVNGYGYNAIGLICEGNRIRPFINGVEQFPNKQEIYDNELTEGTVGVGAMSFGGGNVNIEFNDFSVEPR